MQRYRMRKQGKPLTLFAHRKLENASDFIAWAKAQGFETTVPPEDIHVTLAYSKQALSWPEPLDDQITVRRRSGRSVEALGDGGAVVLRFESPTLELRWKDLVDAGAVWDYPEYQPHVTITWKGNGLDLEQVKPYAGDLIFGPEVFRELDDSWQENMTEKAKVFTKANVVKVDKSLGLIFGWAIVCKVDGEDYFDLQDDHIPEDSMLKATTEFMIESRKNKDMHSGGFKGTVVFAFPLTTDIAKAMGIASKNTGLMIAAKPDDPAILDKYASGDYQGFSIGGQRLEDKVLD